MTDVIMPQMGESIFEGTITRWLKKAGDTVQKDEPLFEISTDKVDAEIPSPVAGVLSEIKFPEGSTVQINTIVAVVSDGGSPTTIAPAVATSGTQWHAADGRISLKARSPSGQAGRRNGPETCPSDL